jgi:putative spermidine/putrescine transport system permease protein
MTIRAAEEIGPHRLSLWTSDNVLLLAVVPALIFFGIIFAYPNLRFIANGLAVGLQDAPSLADILTGRSMLGRLLLTSMALGICTAAGTLLIGYPIAYYLARSTFRWRHYVFVVIFVPLLFSIVIRTFGWIVLLGSNGLLNGLLIQLGAIEAPIVWLYNFPMTVVGLVHVFLPFMVLSILSSLSRIDRRIEEAASILGANPWRAFRHVTLPLSAQGVFGGCAIVFSLTVGAYVTPRLLGGGRVQVLATEIFAQMLEIGDWGMAALLGAALTLVTLVGIAICQLLARQPAVKRR